MRKKLQYWDVNNLYGLSFLQILPTGDFHEIESTKGKNGRILLKTNLRSSDNDKCGYLLKCHLEHSSNKQEKIKHFHFLAEKKTIEVENFRPFKENKPAEDKHSDKQLMDQTNKQT